MVKIIIHNQKNKNKFVETFGMFQLLNGNNNNNFASSSDNAMLKEFFIMIIF